MVQKLGRTKKLIKVGKINGKYDILTVEEKWISIFGNKKRSHWNYSKMKRVGGEKVEGVKNVDKKLIEKEKELLSDISRKICRSFLHVKHQNTI